MDASFIKEKNLEDYLIPITSEHTKKILSQIGKKCLQNIYE